MYVIKISQDLKAILEQTNSILLHRDPDESLLNIRVDFDNQPFVAPTILGVIAAFIEKLRLRHDVVVDCINMHDDNIDYISRMNFFREVGYRYEEYFTRRDGSGKFIPITRVTEENRYNLSTEISRIIAAQWNGIDRSIVASLDWSIYEIFDNIFNHSNTRIDGFVVAQYFPYPNRIDLIVIDGGIGIPRRLKQREDYKSLTTQESLAVAVEHKVTVNPDTNIGAGLYYTKRIVEENLGTLRINTDNAQLLVNNGEKNVCQFPKWSGTIIQLSINTNVYIDPEKVWDDIPSTVTDYMADGTLW